MVEKKTIDEINHRIQAGKANVMTWDELSTMLEKGERVRWKDIDVVTSATCGLMSGTAAVLSFPFTDRGEFTRANEVYLNGIPAFPGPCPNERLGVVDLIVYGTMHSRIDNNYGGGHLLKDLVSGKPINVKLKSKEGLEFEKEITLNKMTYARSFGIRNCFKNYIGMVNRSKTPVPSIFHVRPLKGPYKEVSVSGCGALNPLAKDPNLKVIGIGTKVLINDAIGFVTGFGTRASAEKPNLSGFADLFDMDPYYLGGFQTMEGPEVIMSWAVPIPILDQEIFDNVCVTDNEVQLPIANISDRLPFITSDYGHVWKGTDTIVKFDSKSCTANHEECKANGYIKDGVCPVERICPVHAFTTKNAKLNRDLCFNCGACILACKCGCFQMEMGEVEIDDKIIPITLRQSDRFRAGKLAKRLKTRILNGSFVITEKVSPLSFPNKI